MTKFDVESIFQKVKNSPAKYHEDIHCKMLLKIMGDPDKSTVSAFCCEALISDNKFYRWLKKNELFQEIYLLGKMFAREAWEKEGRELREQVNSPGTTNHKFEYWRMIGWSRFGVGKNSRIRLDLNPNSTPLEHYQQIVDQASKGDFTAGEIKQLMEAINVGLSAHQVFLMQEEINRLKADLAVMDNNTHGNKLPSFSTK
jgi:hypothetical protein